MSTPESSLDNVITPGGAAVAIAEPDVTTDTAPDAAFPQSAFPQTIVAVTANTAVNHEADAAAHAALIKSAFPPQLPPAPATSQAPVEGPTTLAPSASKKTSKDSKMTTTNSLTPRYVLTPPIFELGLTKL